MKSGGVHARQPGTLPSDADNCRIDKRNMPKRKLSGCRGRIDSTRQAVDGIRAQGRTAWLLLTGPCEVEGGSAFSMGTTPALDDDGGIYGVNMALCVHDVLVAVGWSRVEDVIRIPAIGVCCVVYVCLRHRKRCPVRAMPLGGSEPSGLDVQSVGRRGMRERKIAERIECLRQ